MSVRARISERRGALSSLIKVLSVIKEVDKLSYPRNERGAMPPKDIYRLLLGQSQVFDRDSVLEYIRHFGFFPIGCLVRFSLGYLGWVQEVDSHGIPSKVRVCKNLRYPETHMNTLLDSQDFAQIGRVENVVCPLEHGLVPTDTS